MDPPRCRGAKAGLETSHLYNVPTGLKLTTNAVLCSSPPSPCVKMTSRATFITRGNARTRRCP